MKKTVTDLVKSIPERLGLELDLSTPQKAYDFLNDEDFPIFYMSGGCRDLSDCLDTFCIMEWMFKCGYKSMRVFNELFSPENPNKELRTRYGIDNNEATIDMLFDYGDDIAYLSDVSFYEEEGTEYIAALPMGIVDFKSILNACAQICKEANDYIHIETKAVEEIGKGFGYDISCEGVITPFGKFEICDDNSWKFAKGLSWFIELFSCKTFEEMEEICIPYEIEVVEQAKIDTKSGLFYLYKHRDEIANIANTDKAVNLILKYPKLLSYMPKEIQCNKKVAEAFINANEPYMAEYNRMESEHMVFADGTWLRLGALISGETAKLSLNGEVPYYWDWHRISPKVLASWCSDKEIFEKLFCSSMYKWCTMSDEMFNMLDHKTLFAKFPRYITTLKGYFAQREENLDEEIRKKEDLHIRRKYRLSDDVSSQNISLLKAFETLEENENEALKALSLRLNDYELTSLVKAYLISLPKEDRDLLIKHNIRLAYPIRNTLSNDEEIVEYICEMCECAGDFLSDEIVEIRGLKRTNLDISKVCEDCNYC